MEEELKKTVQKYREIFFNILNQAITSVELDMVRVMNSGESDSEMLTKAGIALMIEEMLSVNALVSALKVGGRAKSIVLINSFGQAIDLLNIHDVKPDDINLNDADIKINEMNENDLINNFLDNYGHGNSNKKH